jgi:hypothetical protein
LTFLLLGLTVHLRGRLRAASFCVHRIAGDKIEPADKPLKERGVLAVFAADMMPTPPYAAQNIVAGAICSRMERMCVPSSGPWRLCSPRNVWPPPWTMEVDALENYLAGKEPLPHQAFLVALDIVARRPRGPARN